MILDGFVKSPLIPNKSKPLSGEDMGKGGKRDHVLTQGLEHSEAFCSVSR
jgi:hypothetical protein